MVIKKFKEFYPHDLAVEDININLIMDYIEYLRREGNNSHTIASNISALRSIWNSAVDSISDNQQRSKLISNAPFARLKLSKKRVGAKEKLTWQEIRKIQRHKFEKGSLAYQVRDFFLFAFYCAGIRVGDQLTLTKDNIKRTGWYTLCERTTSSDP